MIVATLAVASLAFRAVVMVPSKPKLAEAVGALLQQPAQVEPAQVEPAQVEPVQVAPAQDQSVQGESAQAEPTQAESTQANASPAVEVPATEMAKPEPDARPAKTPALEAPSDKQPPTLPRAPEFDVVRVERNGEALVAGHSSAQTTITLVDDTKALMQAETDTNGDFMMMVPLAAGEHVLTLSAKNVAGEVASSQSVALAVQPDATAMAALAQPGQPTRILSGVEDKANDLPIQIETVEIEEGGEFFMRGKAQAGASVYLYLDELLAGTTLTDANGVWTLRLPDHPSAGDHQLRADMVPPGADGVRARAQVPFAAPSAVRPETFIVKRGDSLWRISRRMLGKGTRYTQIYEANSNQIRDPDLIWPGQVLLAPKR